MGGLRDSRRATNADPLRVRSPLRRTTILGYNRGVISIPTVLIIGAGASVPYGFPTGPGLIVRLCTTAYMDAMGKLGFSRDEYNEFRYVLRAAQPFSIDSFLAHNEHNWGRFARHAVAAIMLPQERKEELFRLEEYETSEPLAGQVIRKEWTGHWYRHLWNAMCDEGLEGLPNNKLKIVTFNYDRSLEMYVSVAMRNYFPGHPSDRYVKELQELDIVHVYGSLGVLSDGDDHDRDAVGFGDVSLESIRTAAEGIRIISQGREDAPSFMKAQQYCDWAERIIFLGFSYDKTNLNLLNVEGWQDSTSSGKKKRCLGTAYGLKEAEQHSVVCRFRPTTQLSLGSSDDDCLQFLRRRIDLENGRDLAGR